MNKRFSPAPLVAMVLASALFLLIGASWTVASPAAPAGPAVPAGITAVGDTWDSGWVHIAPGTSELFYHNLGGNPNAYAVEMWFQDSNGSLGINRRGYGGVEYGGQWAGAHWQNLTSNTVRVYRQANDTAADQIRIVVWHVLPPTYDSDWTNIAPGETITFSHSLGITATELTTVLWFSDTVRGIHHFSYGGLSVDGSHLSLGAHWHNLTDNTIQVTRHADDSDVQQVRVVLVHASNPDYDSLQALGDWQAIDAGGAFTFTHNLGWDPNLLMARGECYSPTVGGPGIHQWFAGGNHDWVVGWQGAHLQNLTANSVTAVRAPNDLVCPLFRVVVNKRGMQLYIPLVSRNS